MAFDRTNAANLLALKTEVTTDPIVMGYDISGNTQAILKLLNDPDANTGNGTAGQETEISRPFTAAALMDALDPVELDAQQTNAEARGYSHILIEIAAYESIEAYKAKWRSMFAGNSATVAALDAQVKAISRAEALFGVDTNITREDWFSARDS